jgi:HSP20 family protein
MTHLKRSENYLPSFFDRLFGNDLRDWNLSNFPGPNASLPAVNVKETDDDYLVEVAAPGMDKKDFKINYQNNVLTISSEKEVEKEEKEGDFKRREFNFQSFQRSFTIPGSEVNSDKISADYVDGVLNIKLPKQEAAKPKPAKEIKVG